MLGFSGGIKLVASAFSLIFVGTKAVIAMMVWDIGLG